MFVVVRGTDVFSIFVSEISLTDFMKNYSLRHLPEEERKKLLQRLKAKPATLKHFKKAKIDAILADFAAMNLYEEGFLKDLEEGLTKSSVYQ